MAIATFAQMVEYAQSCGPVRVAVAAAAEREVLLAIAEAQQAGIAKATLVGDVAAIRRLQAELKLDLGHARLVDEPEPKRAAVQVISLAAQGEVDVVAKGQIKTDELLSAALRREGGIRERNLLTHVGVFEIPRMSRLIYISDSGVVLYPDIYQKLEIIQNVVDVARCFGLEMPKVAILSATEDVHPSMPGSIDALALSRMAQQGSIEGAVVDGPLSLDVAIEPHAAAVKGVQGPVAGQADILIVPNVESGNIMAKSIQYFARGRMAGLVVGARTPILISSRADTAETRFFSMAMAALLVDGRRKGA
jgi:phosphate butyryltransferase